MEWIMTNKIKYIFSILIILFFFWKIYQYIPYRIEYLGHYDKIWAHRNNSINKANTSEKYFKGIELDLVFNQKEDFLDVNHPPTKSIHLDFANYVSKLDRQPYLWLDIKNLNNNNAKLIYDKLIDIINLNNYPKTKILIETRFPEALSSFTSSGFKTSYYLPFGLSKMNDSILNNTLNHIRKVLNEQSEIGISADYEDYEIIRKNFPNKIKYTWIIDGLRQRDYKVTNRILNDSTVAVVLVSFKTFNGHR